MYEVLGWINVFLLVFNVMLFFVRRFYKYTKNEKIKSDKNIMKIMKFMAKVHKYSGILLLILAPVHGYIALGYKIKWHTGFLLWLSIIFTFLLYALKKVLKSSWIKLHRITAIMIFVFLFIHLINPWLFGF